MMAFDPSKLSPAPWTATSAGIILPVAIADREHGSRPDWEFCALARNAFDVMLRRGWYAAPRLHHRFDTWQTWEVCHNGSEPVMPLRWHWEPHQGVFDDPFTALVEADRWYRENVERKD